MTLKDKQCHSYKHTFSFASIIIAQVSSNFISVVIFVSFGHFPPVFPLIQFIGSLQVCTGLEDKLFQLNLNFAYFKDRIQIYKLNFDSEVFFRK